jgi:hypothetical protein
VFSVARKLITIETREEVFFFVEEIARSEVANLRTVLGSSPREHIKFRDGKSNFFCDIQIRLMFIFRAIKLDKDCEHLSTFTSVTLLSLY